MKRREVKREEERERIEIVKLEREGNEHVYKKRQKERGEERKGKKLQKSTEEMGVSRG